MPTRSMTRSELFSHFATRFDIKRSAARGYFDELARLAEQELKRAGEFELPGVVKLVLRDRAARTGRNPATGQPIQIPAKTVVKARVPSGLKRATLETAE
jgi:DNA-binding protein HU-beta